MWTAIRERFAGEEGAATIEYALMILAIAVICIGAAVGIGTATSSKFADCLGKWPTS